MAPDIRVTCQSMWIYIPAETKLDLGTRGFDGLELYVLVTPHSGLLTVTAALANPEKSRGFSDLR